MEWIQVLTIILSTMGISLCMFLYIANKIDSLQKMIYGEMRDFHGRLCAIEERRIRNKKVD